MVASECCSCTHTHTHPRHTNTWPHNQHGCPAHRWPPSAAPAHTHTHSIQTHTLSMDALHTGGLRVLLLHVAARSRRGRLRRASRAIPSLPASLAPVPLLACSLPPPLPHARTRRMVAASTPISRQASLTTPSHFTTSVINAIAIHHHHHQHHHCHRLRPQAYSTTTRSRTARPSRSWTLTRAPRSPSPYCHPMSCTRTSDVAPM